MVLVLSSFGSYGVTSLILSTSAWETVVCPTVLRNSTTLQLSAASPLALVELKVQGQFPPLAVMPPCLWLIWVSGLTEFSLKEWALVVTYEEDAEAFGTLYKVCPTAATTHCSAHPQPLHIHTS